jgi:hypothetical protein
VRRIIAVSLAVLTAAMFQTSVASASTGDVLRTLHPTVCPTGASGLSTKGARLLMTCPVAGDAVVYEINANTGKAVAPHFLTDLGSTPTLSAIAYDTADKILWGCATDGGGGFALGKIDLATNVFTRVGATSPCDGGMAYDLKKHSVWLTAYEGSALVQVSPATGATISALATGTTLGECGTAGVAIEAGHVLTGTAGDGLNGTFDCGIFATARAKAKLARVTDPGTLGAVSAIACDPKTFASTTSAALWVSSGTSSTLTALEAPESGGTTTPKCR